jgi:hypothetical protein
MATDADPRDEIIEATDEAAAHESRGARLFDIRRLIAALFAVYGVMLIVAGAMSSHAQIAKAAGLNVNLWTGVGMLGFGVLMALWALTRPLRAEGDAPRSEQARGPVEASADTASRGATYPQERVARRQRIRQP